MITEAIQMKASKGNRVKVDYTGTLDDGTVFDSSEGKHPLEFIAGEGQLIKGFDDAVIGMEEGEEKEITIAPEEAYGQRREDLVQVVPKEAFGDKVEPKEGQQLMLRAPTGHQMMATVTKVEGENVTLDMNHPLVGKTLHFKVKVVGVEEVSAEELAAAEEACSCHDCGDHCSTACGHESKEDVAEEISEDLKEEPEDVEVESAPEEKKEE
jgi:peptidylprolyl isomerase